MEIDENKINFRKDQLFFTLWLKYLCSKPWRNEQKQHWRKNWMLECYLFSNILDRQLLRGHFVFFFNSLKWKHHSVLVKTSSALTFAFLDDNFLTTKDPKE